MVRGRATDRTSQRAESRFDRTLSEGHDVPTPRRAKHPTPPLPRSVGGVAHEDHAPCPAPLAGSDVWDAAHVEATGDPAIAAIAGSQHGLITRDQLLAVGVGRGAINHRVARGRLHRVHRRVYLAGHPTAPPLARELAAILACGPDAVLSHRSAAYLWGMLRSSGDDVDVIISGRDGRRPGMRVHRVRRLEARDRTIREGVPVTTPTRTLLDLADAVPTRELERAFEESHVRRLVDRRRLEALLARAPGRHGAAVLRALLGREAGPSLTRSEAEARMLALVRAARLPRPRINARVKGREVDLLWDAQRLVVEVDGYAYHSSRSAFERDHLRDAELGAAGFRVMRVTWRLLVDQPEAVVARLAAALTQSAGASDSTP